MFELLTPEGWLALGQIIIMDVVLAGDNAIVIGLAVAGLPADQRKKAIFWGIAAATALRIAFTLVATQLLGIFGLLLAGGLLLLWVCWKMWSELRAGDHDAEGEAALNGAQTGAPRKTLGQATLQIILADVSMSLDNVIAVAGAAEGHHWSLLAFGLLLSIALMALAANFIAKLLNRHRWIAYVGLAVILFVAVQMVLKGLVQVYPPLGEYIPFAVEDTAQPALPAGSQGTGEGAVPATPPAQ
ncbi:TerC family protein [Aureimonas sp. ME7]|uniref:TerC family protein n=1 Tax=Aureimonas sp. ME7 TaxID=2744252 RepID=UPI0015F65913|nr:TerC family protein [Aureimonas sp. ME7]